MAQITVYFGIENINLTNGQRNTLVSGLQSLGANSSEYPNRRNHWRIRLDNQAIIFEAEFDEDNLTINAIKQRLATIFSVNVATISHSITTPSIGTVITFTHSATNYFRMVCFGMTGGVWPNWVVSNAAAQAYLITNAAAWGDA